MAEHVEDDPAAVAAHQKTFEGFIRFWVYVFGAAIFVLILLALFDA